MLNINYIPKFNYDPPFALKKIVENRILILQGLALLTFAAILTTALHLIYKKIYKKASKSSKDLTVNSAFRKNVTLTPKPMSGNSPVSASSFKVPTPDQIKIARIDSDFFSTEIPEVQIKKAPLKTSITQLQDLYKELRDSTDLPPTLNDDGNILSTRKVINQVILKIQYLGIHHSDEEDAKIYLLLQHITNYLMTQKNQALVLPLEERVKIEKNIQSILLYDMCLAFEHCRDRQTSAFEDLYFTSVLPSENYLQNLTFKNKLFIAFQIERRQKFEQAVYIALKSIHNEQIGTHYAATYRYYMRIYREQFGLGGIADEPSEYEREPWTRKGYEKAVKKEFYKLYTPQHILESFMNLVRTQSNGGKNLSQDLYNYFKDTYNLSNDEMSKLLDEETQEWTPEACMIPLLDFKILTLNNDPSKGFFNQLFA